MARSLVPKLFWFTTVSAWTLATMVAPASAEQRMVRELSYDDVWYYKGETVRKPGINFTFDSGQYCSSGFCPDGHGEMNTDAGWQYLGNWVDGRREGTGEFSNDFFDYVGRFKHGQADGHGVLTCLDGTSYEGTFADGMMTGEFKVGFKGSSSPNGPTRRFVNEGVAINGNSPCPW